MKNESYESPKLDLASLKAQRAELDRQIEEAARAELQKPRWVKATADLWTGNQDYCTLHFEEADVDGDMPNDVFLRQPQIALVPAVEYVEGQEVYIRGTLRNTLLGWCVERKAGYLMDELFVEAQ